MQTTRSTTPTSEDAAPQMKVALARLARLRTLAQVLLIVQRLGWIFAGLVALAVGAGLVDFFIRSPGWMRGIALLFGCSLALEVLRRRVLPALRFSPPLEELALRVERSVPGRSIGLTDVAASGVGLALHGTGHAGPDAPTAAALAAPVQSEAARRLAGVGMFRFVQYRPAGRSVAVAAAAMIAVLGLLAAQPRLTWIGAVRILAPWAGMEWPKRADVEDATNVRYHALGTALALRAGVIRFDGSTVGDDEVEARYRLIENGQPGPVRRMLLTRQDRTEAITIADERGEARSVPALLYESLIEPAALAASRAESGAAPGDVEFEYWFTTSDDRTEPKRVRLVAPPAVRSAQAVVTPPGYAAGAVPERTQDLGAGNDERATVAGVLSGSTVTLTIRLNKAVPLPPASAPAVRDWLFATLGPEATGVTLQPGGRASDTITLTITAAKPVRLVVAPSDEFGIRAADESVLRLDVTEDRPPEATVTRPAENADVLSTATLEFTAEGRDDVALASVAAEYRIARPPGGSVGASPEAPDTYTRAAGLAAPQGPASRTLSATTTLDLSAIGARPGDELWLTALAADTFNLDGAMHAPVRSPVRKIRVISEDQLAEQLWAELAGVRRTAIRQTEQLQRLREDLARGRESDAAAREQAAVSEAVARMSESVARTRDRAERNGLRDRDLTDVMRDARQLLEQARERSSAGQDALRRAAEAERTRDAAGAERARREAAAAQEQAEGALERLAEALDRGQDAWSSRRALERLIRDQQALREQTARAEQTTTGKTEGDLTPQERQQVDRMAQEQESLARRAEEAIRQMLERAQQMQQSDPSTAQALQQAAQRGQRSSVAEQMQQAAQQMRRNQQRSAGQQQQRAEQAMQNMLDELKDAARNRDEVLKRELASLIQTLDQLIARQTEQIRALTDARASGVLAGLDQPMVRLHTATLAALDQARAAGREAKAAADLIDSAQGAQAKAIVALRQEPIDAEEADRQEQIALKQLTLAKQEAENARRQAQQREQQRQRAELKKAYRELLVEQTEVRRITQDLVGQTVDRRTRARLAEVGERQEQVRLTARKLLDDTEDLRESDLFSFAHERLDRAAADAATSLREASATALVVSRQSAAVRILQELLAAMEESEKQDEPFRQNEQAGDGQNPNGGQQQQNKLIPDIAELKMLRGLQNEALRLTREAAEATDAAVGKVSATDAAAMQSVLAEKAKALIQRLQRQPQPQPAPEGAP